MRFDRCTTICHTLLLSAACAAGLVVIAVAGPPEKKGAVGERIVVTLRDAARIGSPVIRISDIADLNGGDEALRKRIAALDLEDAPLPGDTLEITPPQVEFRLRLAGIEVDRVAIRGPAVRVSPPARPPDYQAGRRLGLRPDQIEIARTVGTIRTVGTESQPTSDSPLEQTVLDAAKKCVLARLPWPVDDVSIRLVQPLRREVRQFDQEDEVTCSAEVRSPGTPVGRVSVRVVLTASGRQTLDVPVVLDVRHFDNVVIATKEIQRGQLIAKPDLYFDRREVTTLFGYCSTSENLIGTKAKRAIGAAQMVRQADVEVAGRPNEPFLVKRRDRVKLIGRTEVLLVTVVGEALQDGRVGEVIKVKNVDSNATVHGRVLNATEVEVTQ